MSDPASDETKPATPRSTRVLREAADAAIRLYEDLDHRHVAVRAGYEELRERFAIPLTERGVDAVEVLRDLVRDSEDGLVGSGGPRFFGWVIGGVSAECDRCGLAGVDVGAERRDLSV